MYLKMIFFGFFIISLSLNGDNHFLSFIIPCYNCQDFVSRAIDSILAQKNLKVPFEIVCTDDGSTDNTLAILKDWESRLPNFIVYTHPHNISGGEACNTCIKHAHGDLIFRLDADNVLVPDSVQGLIDLLDATGADGASFQKLYFFTGNFIQTGSPWVNSSNENGVYDLDFCIHGHGGDPACSGNYLYTRTSYNMTGGYHTEHGADTFCFGFRQYATGSRIAVLPDSYYWHFHNPKGYWARGEEDKSNQKLILKTFLQFQEVFSQPTQELLAKIDPITDSPTNYYRSKFELADKAILNHLFKAYRLEECGLLEEALCEYRYIMDAKCTPVKITKKIENITKKLSEHLNTNSEVEIADHTSVADNYMVKYSNGVKDGV